MPGKKKSNLINVLATRGRSSWAAGDEGGAGGFQGLARLALLGHKAALIYEKRFSVQLTSRSDVNTKLALE